VSNEREWRTAYWGTCSDQDCLTNILIYPHADRGEDLPEEDDWDSSTFFMNCPVCGESFDWGGTDHPADIIKNY
jgi:hypothetical protein